MAAAPKATAESSLQEVADAYEAGKEMDKELLQALTFSPPFIIAWSVGYVKDLQMFAILSMMLAPLMVEKAVLAVGGKGAWRGKAESIVAYTKPLQLPASVWLGPMCVVMYFSDSTNAMDTVGMWVLIYLILCVCNYFIGATRTPTPEAEAKDKKKGKQPSGSTTGSTKKRN